MDGELDGVQVIDAFVGIACGRCKSQQGKRQQYGNNQESISMEDYPVHRPSDKILNMRTQQLSIRA